MLCAWQQIKPRIWIVDNGSRPAMETAALPPRAAISLLRSEVNRGFAGGNNIALADILNSERDAVLLLNTDAQIQERDAMLLMEELAQDSKIGAAGPCIMETTTNGRTCPTFGGRDISRYRHTRIFRPPDGGKKKIDVDYVPGTVALLRCEMLRRTGLFDEEYFFSGEMADLCARARKAGYRCITAVDATAIHAPDTASELRETLYAYYTLRNRFLYTRKHAKSQKTLRAARWLGIGALMAGSAILRGKRAQARALLLAMNDALSGRFGNRHEQFGF